MLHPSAKHHTAPTVLKLEPKKSPAQRRSTETYELILHVTAELLAEVGIGRLSTNLVCQRAGLSPPALYRYFPNKYALLHELGIRLMTAQNVLIEECLTPEVLINPKDTLQPALVKLFLETHRVTKESTAGPWVTRAMRAVPALSDARIQSHREVTAAMHQGLQILYPSAPVDPLEIAVRLSVELMYAAIETLFDDPELEPMRVAQATAWLVYDMFVRVGVIPGKSSPD
jgi:AcrR family transcriptional regulator